MAVKAKEANGFMVFTELDHAAAAKKFGLDLLPRTVIVFGTSLGTGLRGTREALLSPSCSR
jgi:uncharacterized protein (DUF302 family)